MWLAGGGYDGEQWGSEALEHLADVGKIAAKQKNTRKSQTSEKGGCNRGGNIKVYDARMFGRKIVIDTGRQ